jgi:hypothetical protein
VNTYSSFVFLHVIAAIGLFAALVIEWMSSDVESGRELRAVPPPLTPTRIPHVGVGG